MGSACMVSPTAVYPMARGVGEGRDFFSFPVWHHCHGSLLRLQFFSADTACLMSLPNTNTKISDFSLKRQCFIYEKIQSESLIIGVYIRAESATKVECRREAY